MRDSCKYRFMFYILKNPRFSFKRFYESMIKTTFLSWQIYVQNSPEQVKKKELPMKCVHVWEKRWQNLCRWLFFKVRCNSSYKLNNARYSALWKFVWTHLCSYETIHLSKKNNPLLIFTFSKPFLQFFLYKDTPHEF